MTDFNKEKGPDDLQPSVPDDLPALFSPEVLQGIQEHQEQQAKLWDVQNAETKALLDELNAPEDEEEEGEGQ